MRRFALLFPANAYYGHLSDGLAQAFRAEGVATEAVTIPSVAARALFNFPGIGETVRKSLEKLKITDTLAVNIPKSVLEIPQEIRHHCWVQDIYEWLAVKERSSDRTYALIPSDAQRFDLPLLPAATDYDRYFKDPQSYDADVAFAGCLPAHDLPQLFRGIDRLVRAIVEKICSVGDYLWDREYAEYLLVRAEISTGINCPEELREHMLFHIASRLVRFAQRLHLVELLIPMCARHHWRLVIAGSGWEALPQCQPYAHQHIPAGPELADFYQRAKINLHINGNTNLQPRLIECLGAGGTMLAQELPTDYQANDLRSSFSAETVPTWDCPETLEAIINQLLSRDYDRKEMLRRGHEIVRRDHTLLNRVKKILEA